MAGDGGAESASVAIEVSFCVVNTEQRELLLRCLDAIARRAGGARRSTTEVLVLDNASRDGSAGAARGHPASTEVIASSERRGKARERHRSCCSARAAASACCSTRTPSCMPGATAALHARARRAPAAARAGAALLRPDGAAQPSAWRFPTPATALAGALLLHRRLTVQSARRARARGRLGAVGRAARAPRGRRSDRLAGPRRSSSTPTRSTSASACATPAGAALYVPAPRPSTTSSSRPARCPSGGSSSSRATATATCASTTRRARRAPCAG